MTSLLQLANQQLIENKYVMSNFLRSVHTTSRYLTYLELLHYYNNTRGYRVFRFDDMGPFISLAFSYILHPI